MKIFLKKMAVMAAAVTILFAFSACDFLNGKGNQDDSSTTTQTDSTGTSTTNTTNTSGTTTGDNNTTGGGTTTGGETTGGGTTTGGDQTVTIVAEFDDLTGCGINYKFYSDNIWKLFMNFEGEIGAFESGTYTGNPAQDGEVVAILTKMVPNGSETGELEDCDEQEMSLTITDGIIEIYDEDEDETLYLIRKANEVANYKSFVPPTYTINTESAGFILDYRFYENYTWRLLVDGIPSVLGSYTGNPSIDGDITIAMKYQFSETDGLEPASNTANIPLTITNGCFSGDVGELDARELEVFKAQAPTEGSETMDTFFRFYADNDEDEETDGFFILSSDMMGIETPWLYGTYTGNPTSTAADNQVVLDITYGYLMSASYNPSTGETVLGTASWKPIGEDAEITTSVTLTITNNQFTYVLLEDELTYTRQ